MNKIAELNMLKEALADEFLQKAASLDSMIKEAISNELLAQVVLNKMIHLQKRIRSSRGGVTTRNAAADVAQKGNTLLNKLNNNSVMSSNLTNDDLNKQLGDLINNNGAPKLHPYLNDEGLEMRKNIAEVMNPLNNYSNDHRFDGNSTFLQKQPINTPKSKLDAVPSFGGSINYLEDFLGLPYSSFRSPTNFDMVSGPFTREMQIRSKYYKQLGLHR